MRGGFVAIGLAVSIAAVGLGSGTAGAAKPNITAVGNVHCSGGAKLATFVSTQALPGSPHADEANPGNHNFVLLRGRLGCAGTTGNPSVRVFQAKVTGSWYRASGYAPSLYGVQDGWRISVEWKAKGGKVSGTSIQYSNSQASLYGWQIPSPSAPVGTSSVLGSFANSGPSKAQINVFTLMPWLNGYIANNGNRRDGAGMTLDL